MAAKIKLRKFEGRKQLPWSHAVRAVELPSEADVKFSVAGLLKRAICGHNQCQVDRWNETALVQSTQSLASASLSLTSSINVLAFCLRSLTLFVTRAYDQSPWAETA